MHAAHRSGATARQNKLFDKSACEVRALPEMDVHIAGEEIAADESSGIGGRFGTRAAHSPRDIIGADRFIANPSAVPEFMPAQLRPAICQ